MYILFYELKKLDFRNPVDVSVLKFGTPCTPNMEVKWKNRNYS